MSIAEAVNQLEGLVMQESFCLFRGDTSCQVVVMGEKVSTIGVIQVESDVEHLCKGRVGWHGVLRWRRWQLRRR